MLICCVSATMPRLACSSASAGRSLSQRGHLSNEDAAAFARRMAESGTRRFVLAHLSRENNTPQRALQVMGTALSGLDVSVEVAPRGELSGCYEPEVTACRR